MNTKEINEIRRRVRRDRSNMAAIYGCYVNDNKQIVSQFRQSTAMMSENEADKYFSLLKRSLSGSLGKNLIDIHFATHQVAGSPEHKLLMDLRSTELGDEEVLMAFYRKVMDTVSFDGGYLILLGVDKYDVPFKSKDDASQADGSEAVYTYLLCAICPVKQTKAQLYYQPESKEFHDGNIMNIVCAPELGFLFPAFDNRSTNIYNALYYNHSPKENYQAFVDAVFSTKVPKPAFEQKQSFEALLSGSLQEDCSMEVVQSVHDQLCQYIDMHKESKVPEALTLSKDQLTGALSEVGVSQEHIAKFSVDYDEAFGFEAQVHPKNIIDDKRFEVRTPDVSIKVARDRTDLIETRIIGGVKYILICAEEDIQVNGVSIHIGEGETVAVSGKNAG